MNDYAENKHIMFLKKQLNDSQAEINKMKKHHTNALNNLYHAQHEKVGELNLIIEGKDKKIKELEELIDETADKYTKLWNMLQESKQAK